MSKKIGTAGFLFDSRKNFVLLHHRSKDAKFNPDKWAFFAGLCYKNETPERCFARELREETGVKAMKSEIQPLDAYLNKNIDPGTFRYSFFVEKDSRKTKIVLGEGAGFKWIPLQKVFKYDLTRYTKKDLKTFIKMMKLWSLTAKRWRSYN